MKIHIVVIGFGQNRKHLIPALMSVSNEFPEVKVTIIDRRDFDPIIKNDEWLTEDQIRWCKERFLHEDDDNKEDIINNLILKGITKNTVCRRIFYLSIPHDAFEYAIKRYSDYADIFVIEKPWAIDQFHLQKIIKSSGSAKKILGVDHYLWKPEVRYFLKYMQSMSNFRLMQESHDFDIILCEPKLDPPTRTYFWKTGVAVDMIPHVLPMLDRLFGSPSISIEKAIPAMCKDSLIQNVSTGSDNLDSDSTLTADNFSMKETFAELILSISSNSDQKKIVHIVLGKGVTVHPIFICREKKDSQKFFYGSSGNLFLDLNQHQIIYKCKKEALDECESPWYYIFKSLVSGEYNYFIDIESIKKFVSLYPRILNSFNHFVKQITGKEYTTDYARLLLAYDELQYSKGEFPLTLKHSNCCFSNRVDQ
jgi:Glucose-6-phosphate dehydrogenase, NAD binding domain